MTQRYKVFFNDRRLFIAHKDKLPGGICREFLDDYNSSDLENFLSDFEDSGVSDYCLCSSDPDSLFASVSELFKPMEAAGGVVRHFSGRYLFIRRFGKWDLPKGKLESGEKPDEAALREVSEECGIQGMTIRQDLPSTYHTYRLNGERVIKRIYWYLMDYSGSLQTNVQTEEGIIEAVWLIPSQFDIILSNTYRSLIDLIREIPAQN